MQNSKYWTPRAKLNSFLLLILIILMLFAIRIMKQNKDVYLGVWQSKTPSSYTQKKEYSSEFGKFSYQEVASEQTSNGKGIINIGTSPDDPYLETVGFFSDTNQVSPLGIPGGIYDENNRSLGFQTYGRNTFEVYKVGEGGGEVFILMNGIKAISVSIPYRGGGNETTMYVDLSSISFN